LVPAESIHRFAAHGFSPCPVTKSEAAALFLRADQLPLRAEVVLSSNKTLSAWAKIFGDPVAVAAMVDSLVHHAEIIVLKGDSYRLKGKGRRCWAKDRPAESVQFSTGGLCSDFQPTLTDVTKELFLRRARQRSGA
jgi:hypothetical protein